VNTETSMPYRLKNGKFRFPAFDAIRVFATLDVIAEHALPLSYYFKHTMLGTRWAFVSITVFFMLSGFLMAQTEVPEDDTVGTIGRLAWQKFIRLYPVHLLTALACCTYLAFNWKILLAHLTMTQALVPDASFYFGLNGPSWYVSCLFFLFLIYPVAARHLGFFLVFSLLLPVVVSLCLPWSRFESCLQLNPIGNGFKFLLGVLLFRCVRTLFGRCPSLLAKPTTRERIRWTLLEVGALLLLYVWHVSVWSWIAGWKSISEIGFMQLLRSFSPLVSLTVVFMVFAVGRGYVSKVFSSRIFALLGTISFSFYLIHIFVRDSIVRYDVLRMVPISARFAVYVLLTLILACVVHFCYEKPMTGLLRKVRLSAAVGAFLRRMTWPFVCLLIAAFYLWLILPRPVDVGRGIVPTLTCDHIIPGQVVRYSPESYMLHPGNRPTRATFPLDGIDATKMSCRVRGLDEKTDVIVNFYVDGNKVESRHVRGLRSFDVKVELKQSREFVIETDSNGPIAYDSTVVEELHFWGMGR